MRHRPMDFFCEQHLPPKSRLFARQHQNTVHSFKRTTGLSNRKIWFWVHPNEWEADG